ncbi:MAG TPA: TetR/AcrR family transcriptional regulator [Cyclobacteriaceae bacterium]|nr:TetR/AcrR family transcriptional regulator [Cyclobacteriaceae bacterium]
MSPRTEAQNREIRQESMQKIMDAAFRLIAKKGYEATSIAEIAKEAGVSKGLLYNYFSGKQDLLEKMVLNAVDQADRVMESLVSDDPIRTLEGIIRRLFHELRERSDYFRLLMELTFKIDRFEFVQKMAAERFQAYIAFLEDLFRRIGMPDPAGEARMFAALCDGIGIQYAVLKGVYSIDQLEEFLVNKYCSK